MGSLQYIKNKINSFLKKENKTKNVKVIFLLLLSVLIFVIFFSGLDVKSSKKNVKSKTTLSAVEYCETVENRLINVLGKIKGIGNVDVFVMVDASPTIKFLEETKSETTKKEQSEIVNIETEIVMQKNGTITSPVVVVELMPKITGVLIVASGANNIKLKTSLINTVSAILNINISNVEVLEGK